MPAKPQDLLKILITITDEVGLEPEWEGKGNNLFNLELEGQIVIDTFPGKSMAVSLQPFEKRTAVIT